jgi:hypothetical protein
MAAPFVNVPFMAGARFGLSAKDLAEKYGLDEDTSEGIVQEFGATEPARMRTATYKGRGGNVLGYQTGGRPTVEETVFEGLPLAINMPKTPEAPEAPESETPTPEAPKSLSEMSAQEIFSNYSKYDVGEQGLFGGQDVDYLRAQGVGDPTIREVARMSSATQQTPAAVYKRLGGTLKSPQSTASGPDPQQYAKSYLSGQTDVGAQGIFGGQDVDAMRSQGYTDEQIRATAQAIRRTGQNIPDAVFRRLGNF